MNIDEQKNDIERILPKINWKIADKEITFKINENLDLFCKRKKKNFLNFRLIKPIVKRTPSNFHLINVLLKNEDIKENNSINRENLTPFNIGKTELFNNVNNNLYKKFSSLLKKGKFNKLKRKTKEEIEPNHLNMIYVNNTKNIINNKKENGNRSPIIRNKLIANRILDVRLHKKAMFFRKKKLYRNKNSPSFFSPSSAYISFKKEANDINKSMINSNKNNSANLDYSNKSMTNLDNSLNSNGSTILSPNLSKEKKSKEKGLFIAKLKIKTKTIPKHKSLKPIKYTKKWELPKSFSFSKLSGREKEIKNPFKFKVLERLYEYTPNYDSILCNDNKAYVKYNPILNQDFKQYKKYKIRKFVFNHSNLINSPANNYNIINLLNERKVEVQKRIDEKKEYKIMENFVYNYKKNYK